jgi:hypothetical protein
MSAVILIINYEIEIISDSLLVLLNIEVIVCKKPRQPPSDFIPSRFYKRFSNRERMLVHAAIVQPLIKIIERRNRLVDIDLRMLQKPAIVCTQNRKIRSFGGANLQFAIEGIPNHLKYAGVG